MAYTLPSRKTGKVSICPLQLLDLYIREFSLHSCRKGAVRQWHPRRLRRRRRRSKKQTLQLQTDIEEVMYAFWAVVFSSIRRVPVV